MWALLLLVLLLLVLLLLLSDDAGSVSEIAVRWSACASSTRTSVSILA